MKESGMQVLGLVLSACKLMHLQDEAEEGVRGRTERPSLEWIIKNLGPYPSRTEAKDKMKKSSKVKLYN